jgi:uncharacterized protein (TIGR03435 family)
MSLEEGVPMMIGGASTIEDVIRWLQRRVDRPIVDRTGVTGEFAIRFEVPAATGVQATPADNALPHVSSEIATAVREQLGLKLVPRKEPLEVLVISDAEEPTPN